MKKILGVAFMLSLLVLAPAFAKETGKEAMPGMAMDKNTEMPMMGKGRQCPMMGKTQMVATEGGGVILLAGNKLMKYDADLNLVKEVEVPLPAFPMRNKQCPMTGKVADQGASPAALEYQEKTTQ